MNDTDAHPILYSTNYQKPMKIVQNTNICKLLTLRAHNYATGTFKLTQDIPIAIRDDNNKIINLGTMMNPDVEKIIEHSKISPFGKGDKTIIDPNVRDGREISADKFHHEMILSLFRDNNWKSVKYSIGIKLGFKNLEVKFYKMAIYTEGGHFDKHIDTNHADNHIGTLLINIPSEHKGGNLHFSQNNSDKNVWITDSSENQDELNYVAFYTNYEHELKTIESGYRIVLQFDIMAESIEDWNEEEREEPQPKRKKRNRYEDDEENIFEGVGSSYERPRDNYANTKILISEINKVKHPIALPLYHLYTKRSLLPKYLKGCDSELYEGLKKSGYEEGKNLFLTHFIGMFNYIL